MGGVTWAWAAVAAITSPVFSTISRGSSGLPVAWAGHTAVQRPHIVQASVSSSCFHVKSSTTEAPNVSSDVSVRFGIGLHRALGPLAVLQVHVQRAGEHVPQHRDGQDDQEGQEGHHVQPTHETWCQTSSVFCDSPSTSVASG